jgi:hypothetical protein
MRTLKKLTTALALTLTIGACAPAAGNLHTSELAPREVATIQVENFNMNNVVVYLVRDGMRHRLGQLGTHQTKRFEVPRRMIRDADNVRLVVDPVGPTTEFTSRRSAPYATEPLRVPSGNDVVFTVENNLAASRYSLVSG